MPFTFSHPAAALGLGWIGLPMAALVAGTMVPDVPMFVPGPVEYSTTHSWLGIVTIDVLIGCIGVVIWVGLLHDPIVDICPAFVRERLPATMRYTRRQWALVPVAVLVGAATHVAWDSFTHEGRWGVRRIAWLRGEHEGWAGSHWSQALSTIIGFAIVAWWSLRTVLRRPRGRRRSTLPLVSHVAVWTTLAVTAAVGAIVGLTTLDAGVHAAAIAAAEAATTAAAAVLVGWCLMWQALTSR